MIFVVTTFVGIENFFHARDKLGVSLGRNYPISYRNAAIGYLIPFEESLYCSTPDGVIAKNTATSHAMRNVDRVLNA